MAAIENLSAVDKEFLAKCEEELKHRFTENDVEFMKVFNGEKSIPPVMKSWRTSQGRMNDRRHDRRPYERPGYRDYERRDNRDRRDHQDRREHQDKRDHHDRRDNYERRGYSDYNSGNGSGAGYGNKRYRR